MVRVGLLESGTVTIAMAAIQRRKRPQGSPFGGSSAKGGCCSSRANVKSDLANMQWAWNEALELERHIAEDSNAAPGVIEHPRSTRKLAKSAGKHAAKGAKSAVEGSPSYSALRQFASHAMPRR